MIPVRKLNEQWVYLGLPGSGKSWKARIDTWEAAQAQGGFVIAHDPTDSFDDEGVDIPHLRYKSPAELARGVQAHGGGCVHILATSNGDDVLRVALRLAQTNMAQARQGHFRPTYIYWDEAVAAGDMKARGLSDLWMDALARRRRYGIAPTLTAQTSFFAHRSVLMMSTRTFIFTLIDPEDIDRMKAVGVPKEWRERLHAIPEYEYLEMRRGRVVHEPNMDAPSHSEPEVKAIEVDDAAEPELEQAPPPTAAPSTKQAV